MFWVLSSLLTGGGEVYGETVPALIWFFVCFSFAQRVGVAQTACRGLSEETVPRVAVGSMCSWEEASLGSLCVTILN